MLEIDALGFAYPGTSRRYRFELSVAPGETVAVTGESGSGKSTLLDLIAGFLVPDAGAVRLDGRDLTALPPERRPVSILFQSENLFDHLTAGRNLDLGLPRAVPRAERSLRIDAALAEVGLDGLAARRVSQLSGGQKQRVALARTLLRDQPVLLLDEPFSGLDEDTAAAMRALVRGMVEDRGWHAVLVSHARADVEALARRHYRLADGALTPDSGAP